MNKRDDSQQVNHRIDQGTDHHIVQQLRSQQTNLIRRVIRKAILVFPLKVLLIMMVFVTFVACGSHKFLGRIEAPPGWVGADLNTWSQPIDSERQDLVIYGRGVALNRDLINERRATAEAQAVNDVAKRFLEHFKRVGPTSPALINEVEGLSWVEIALPVERFFDPVKNAQYALVQINKDQFLRRLSFILQTSDDTETRAKIQQIIDASDKIFVKP